MEARKVTLEGYQTFTESTDQSPMTPWYYGLGAAGEAGEVAEKILVWKPFPDPDALSYELGDVLWYVSRLARTVCGLSLHELLDVSPPVRATDPLWLAVRLTAYTGLVSDRIKKAYRRNSQNPLDASALAQSLAGALATIKTIAEQLCDLTLEDIAARNIQKLEDRRARGVITAAGDYR